MSLLNIVAQEHERERVKKEFAASKGYTKAPRAGEIIFIPRFTAGVDFLVDTLYCPKYNGISLALEPLPSMGSGYFRVCGELGIVKSSWEDEQ